MGTGSSSGGDLSTAAREAAKSPFSFCRSTVLAALIIVAVVAAAALRLPLLDNRPMHCDEANHAVKLGHLLERGEYAYDPREYHGPSLNYTTLPVAWLKSAAKLTELSEIHLRLVPALFGMALVALVFLLCKELGVTATFCAAMLTALSPAMVFYSRYYIQEMLLVCFTFAAMVALWRFARLVGEESDDQRRPRLRQTAWLVMLGASVGMMHTSKETCVIALFSMTIAAAVAMRQLRQMGLKRIVRSSLLVLCTAAGVSALFFSSFFDNPHGVFDSYATYFHYFTRASGQGSAGLHNYPFDHYFRRLFYWPGQGSMLWTEASIGILALLGVVAAVRGKGLRPNQVPIARFLSVYTLLMTVIYCVIPYKTPWCALGFLQGMILLAGIGAAVLLRANVERHETEDVNAARIQSHGFRALAAVLLLLAAAHLGWQAWRAAFVDYENPKAPYVYVQTTSDLMPLLRRVEQIAAMHPDGKNMRIHVVCPDADFWPLPWYLRDFTRVRFFGGKPKGPAASLIITQPSMKSAVMEYLYVDQPPGKRPLFTDVPPAATDRRWQLRPGRHGNRSPRFLLQWIP